MGFKRITEMMTHGISHDNLQRYVYGYPESVCMGKTHWASADMSEFTTKIKIKTTHS